MPRSVIPAEARQPYRFATVTLHVAIHEEHDRIQAAKLVSTLEQSTEALNAIGRVGPRSTITALQNVCLLQAAVACTHTAVQAMLLAGVSGQADLPDDLLATPVQLSDYPGHIVIAATVAPADGMPAMIRADQYAAKPPTSTHHPEAGNA